MVEQQQSNSQDDLQQGQHASAQGSVDASQSTQQTTQADTGAQVSPTRPEGLADEFWDDKGGVKFKELSARLTDLSKFKTETEAARAALPESADKYEVALPKDFQLPEGWQINADDPAWKAGREFAHTAGLTQDQFAKLASVYVQSQIDVQKSVDSQLAGAVKARDEALGANGTARVEAVNNWFKSAFDPKVADQLSRTLFTPDIVSAFEKIQLALTNGGIAAFRQGGRKEGRDDGKPDNWESMSPVDRRTWNLAQQADKRA